eukprot:11169111-Lingulodinium_polyedra.AAC.1
MGMDPRVRHGVDCFCPRFVSVSRILGALISRICSSRFARQALAIAVVARARRFCRGSRSATGPSRSSRGSF